MPLIVKDFDLPLSLSTVAIAVGKLSYVMLIIPGGMIVDKYGPRICVILGILGLAIVLVFYALLVNNFTTLIIAHVIMAIFASVSGVPVYSIFIAQWFRGSIGLAMGLVLAGYSAAGTALPALLGPVATALGWRVALGVQCCLLWFVGLPVSYFFLKEHHDDDDASNADSQTPPAIPAEPMAKEFSFTYFSFALSYFLLQYCFGCFGENILFFLTIDREIALGFASLFFSALNMASFSAKLVGGHLGDRYDRFHVAAVASGLAAVGIFFLFVAPIELSEHGVPKLTHSSLAVLFFIACFGFGYGAVFNCLYALTPIVFGRANLGRTQSTFFGIGLIGNALGSVVTGVLRARYKSYDVPFMISALSCTTNFFLFNLTRLSLKKPAEAASSKQQQESVSTPPSADLPPRPAGVRYNDNIAPAESMPNLRSQIENTSRYGAIPVRTGDSKFGAQLRNSSSSSGMIPQHGFPIVRDWSNSSLRRVKNSTKYTASMSVPAGLSIEGMGIRKSSTMEAMIDSGILSASLEPVGYLGKQNED